MSEPAQTVRPRRRRWRWVGLLFLGTLAGGAWFAPEIVSQTSLRHSVAPTLAEIEDAAEVLRGVVVATPFEASENLSDLLGALASEAPTLAAGGDVRFMNDVALRLADG